MHMEETHSETTTVGSGGVRADVRSKKRVRRETTPDFKNRVHGWNEFFALVPRIDGSLIFWIGPKNMLPICKLAHTVFAI